MTVKQQSARTASARRRIIFGAHCAAVLTIVTMGCGQGESQQSGPAVAPKAAAPSPPAKQPTKESSPTATDEKPATTVADAAAVGSLAGTVTITGTVPELALLVKQGDAGVRDAAICGAHNIPDESLIVKRDANHGIANVFVYLVKAPSKKSGPTASEPFILDQKGCQYIPHAAVVRVGQPVQFVSSDAVAHNVHTFPKRNTAFNQTVQANSREGIKLQYEAFEAEPIEIKCDIHPWMHAYHLVVDHPYAAVTDESGHFEIKNLPAGAHSFRVWHERGRVLERDYKVEIQSGQTKEVSISFSAEKFSAVASQP